MALSYLPLVFALFLSVVHFLSNKISVKIERYHPYLISLSAGIFITYILLAMLPELSKGFGIVGESIYLALLGGFAFFHLIEKYTYQHYRNKRRLMDDIAHLYMAGFIFDSFVVGFTIVILYKISTPLSALAILPIVPYALHCLASSLSLEHIHERFASTVLGRLSLSSSTFIGAVIATMIDVTIEQFYILFAFLLGILIYIVTRNTVPEGRKGVPTFFVIGIILTLFLLWISHFAV